MKSALPALAMIFSSVALILVWELSPPKEGSVLVVFNPAGETKDLGTRLQKADAALVDRSALIPGGFIVSSTSPGLPDRLRKQGAWLVMDAQPGLGCLARPAAS